jgi:hypothetical protein
MPIFRQIHLTRCIPHLILAGLSVWLISACHPSSHITSNPPQPSTSVAPSPLLPPPAPTTNPPVPSTDPGLEECLPEPHCICWKGSGCIPSDIAITIVTTLNGKVYDDEGLPLDGVTITVRSLHSSYPFEESKETLGGGYVFNNVPANIPIEILASKPGYASRRRVEVLKENNIGDPDANQYDFGVPFSEWKVN